MTRSEICEQLAEQFPHLERGDCDRIVEVILTCMVEGIEEYGRVELRGFGIFTLNWHKAHTRRNPETGDLMHLGERLIPHFSASNVLIKQLNADDQTLK